MKYGLVPYFTERLAAMGYATSVILGLNKNLEPITREKPLLIDSTLEFKIVVSLVHAYLFPMFPESLIVSKSSQNYW